MVTNACPQGPIDNLKIKGAIMCPACGRGVQNNPHKVDAQTVRYACPLCKHEWEVKR